MTSRPRTPRIAGVAGGVGTTTLAAALRGHDGGTEPERGVDVLVCRATGQSLHRAAATVTRLVADGRPRPLLVVTADVPGPVRGTSRARMRMIEPQVAALVVLPYVERWRELTDPLVEASGLAEQPAERLPRPLRGYAEALAGLTALLLRSGLLHHPAATGPLPAATDPDPAIPGAAVDTGGFGPPRVPLFRVAAPEVAR